jgi:predicted RNA binding protein YcfA (HicA-like mRNA interferase family)
MRLPRDLTGADLVKRLSVLGYRQTRQTGSHVRVTCDAPRQHHVTIPLHDPLRVGTLAFWPMWPRRMAWSATRSWSVCFPKIGGEGDACGLWGYVPATLQIGR